jgi:hypothetical protein
MEYARAGEIARCLRLEDFDVRLMNVNQVNVVTSLCVSWLATRMQSQTSKDLDD